MCVHGYIAYVCMCTCTCLVMCTCMCGVCVIACVVVCMCVCVCVNVCGCMLVYFYVLYVCMHLLCKFAHVDTHTYDTPSYQIVKLLLLIVFI